MSTRYTFLRDFVAYLSVDRVPGCLGTFVAQLFHDPSSRSLARAELTVRTRFQLGLGVSTERSERETTLSFHVPGASLWLTFPFTFGKADSWKDDEISYDARLYRVEDMPLPDYALSWHIGRNPHHWSSSDSQQWRQGMVHLSDAFGGVRCDFEQLQDEVHDAPLPEGPCKVRVVLGRHITYYRRFPALQHRESLARVSPIQSAPAQATTDDIFSEYARGYICDYGFRTRTVSEAVGAFVGAVLHQRERAGVPFMPPWAKPQAAEGVAS